MNSEQREFYWAHTKVAEQGYLAVEVPREYVRLVEDLALKANADPDAGDGPAVRFDLGSLRPFAQLIESPLRSTVFFRANAGPGMLTVWRFMEAGARIYAHSEFLNVDVSGERGTLALAKPHEGGDSLWKLTWIAKGVQFELYVPDVTNPDGPSLNASEVIGLAQAIRFRN